VEEVGERLLAILRALVVLFVGVGLAKLLAVG
jgi:hypothetical protein